MLPVTEPPYPPPPPPGPNPYGQNPYGQPPYGQGPPPAQPPAGGYPPPPPPPPGQPPYGGPPSGQNPYGGPVYAARPPAYRYAGWGVRVGAYLIDMLLSTVASIPLFAGYVWLIASIESSTSGETSEYTGGAGPIVLMVVGVVPAVGFWVWNLCIRQGRTGASLGKSNLGLRLLKEDTGQPMGAGLSFVRQLAHYVDSAICYLGYLWPLWDDKRQTIADKIMSTVVVHDR